VRSLLGGVFAAAASRRVPLVAGSGGGLLSGPAVSAAGMDGQLNAMTGTGTLYSIVRTLAESTSLAPWCMYRAHGLRDDPMSPRREVTRHAALDLWRRPNLFMTRQELVEAVQQHVELVGEGYLLVVRVEGFALPVELWPILPSRMLPVPDPEEFLAGWVYLGPNGERIPLGLDEVVQIRVPNPVDPFRGLGPVQSILADLESARLSAEWNRRFFLNGAQPGGIIEVDDELVDRELDKLRRQFQERHQGVYNAHRVAVLENGMKWKDRSVSHEDMQFVQLRNVSREVIREAFGISKTMLGLTEDVNRATAEAAMMTFARDRRKPRLERWKQALNSDLLPMYGAPGANVEFDFDAEIPEDEVAEAAERKSKTEGAKALAATGWHPDDVLASMGLPPMRWVGPPATTGLPGVPAGPALNPDDVPASEVEVAP